MLHKPPCRQIEKQARTFVAYPAPGALLQIVGGDKLIIPFC